METIHPNQHLTIGEAIKQKRLTLKYKQNEFAKLVGISNVTLSEIENNKQYPHNKTLTSICNQLNINVTVLMIQTLHVEHLPILFQDKFEYHKNKLLEIINDSTPNKNELVFSEFTSYETFKGYVGFLIPIKSNKQADHIAKNILIHEAWKTNIMMPVEIIDNRNYLLAGQKYQLPQHWHTDATEDFICQSVFKMYTNDNN